LFVRRLSASAAVALIAFALSTVDANAAHAAGPVGYVRLAHLSPDTPNVDVYVNVVGSKAKPQIFPGVGYGTVSKYLPLPVGSYAVAMRLSVPHKAPDPNAPVVLTTTVTVASGKAYTVAGVGKHADLGLRVLDDDLTLPPPGKAKVRVVQASVHAPVLDCYSSSGQWVARNVDFATTTGYADVKPGKWTLRVSGANNGPVGTLSVRLASGDVYSLLVLDAKSGGLAAQLRVDAAGAGTVPNGGVPTGEGGTADDSSRTPLVIGAVLVLLVGLAGSVAYRRRTARG
jgi:hypothetical protein